MRVWELSVSVEMEMEFPTLSSGITNCGPTSLTWQEAPYTPILSPGAPEWKKALVYQLDCVSYNGETRIYYNSRDEWLDGIERIGLSFLPDPSLNIYKLR